MDKTAFEKRIEQRAEEKFNEQLSALAIYINNHPIGKSLKITVDGEFITLANFGGNYGLINQLGLDNKNSSKTNLAEVKEKVIEEYRKKETDEILSKLDNLSYLFDR